MKKVSNWIAVSLWLLNNLLNFAACNVPSAASSPPPCPDDGAAGGRSGVAIWPARWRRMGHIRHDRHNG